MLWFRSALADLPLPVPPGAADPIAALIDGAFRPGHFFVAPPLSLHWEAPHAETIPWEIYRGRLVDPATTREQNTFLSWNVYAVEAGERSALPLLSAKWDRAAGLIHVTRALQCHAWEAYDAGDRVILSREVRKWQPELVGSIDLRRFSDRRELLDELAGLLFRAVIGTSRLPLTSVEAPLPAFSLGRLLYLYHNSPAEASPLTDPARVFDWGWEETLAPLEQAKLLECALRAAEPAGLEALAESLLRCTRSAPAPEARLLALCRTLFNEVALSPYTAFVDRFLELLRLLVHQGRLSATGEIDLLSYLLRQTARHLTAYDLITFHHRGANYPDALLLDAVLRAYLAALERHPQPFITGLHSDEERRCRLRRRALRLGWFLWHFYRGLAVPETPTSPGENARVLPAPLARVPEEQLVDPGRRPRHLFEDSLPELPPASRQVLSQSWDDLHDAEEWQEFGRALFLDRPLGQAKPVGQPDQTPLFGYVAFSRSLALGRIAYAHKKWGILSEAAFTTLCEQVRGTPVVGLPLPDFQRPARPGVVDLADAARVAGDWVLIRSTRQSIRDCLGLFDFQPLRERINLDWLESGRPVLLVRQPRGAVDHLVGHDSALVPCFELAVDVSQGFASRAGFEYPRAGLRVVRLRDPAGADQEWIEPTNLVLPPRAHS